jgi:hypothetical protein
MRASAETLAIVKNARMEETGSQKEFLLRPSRAPSEPGKFQGRTGAERPPWIGAEEFTLFGKGGARSEKTVREAWRQYLRVEFLLLRMEKWKELAYRNSELPENTDWRRLDLPASAELAPRLRRSTDHNRLSSQAEEPAQRIHTNCWDPRDSYYYTVDVQCVDRRAELIQECCEVWTCRGDACR